MKEIKNRKVADYKIEFNNEKDYIEFKKLGLNVIRDQVKYNQVTVSIPKDEINDLFDKLTAFDLKFIAEVKYTLEKHFNQKIKEVKEKEND